jgi:hypothetical protein
LKLAWRNGTEIGFVKQPPVKRPFTFLADFDEHISYLMADLQKMSTS